MIMEIDDDDDDFYENRLSSGSMSCLFPPLMCLDTIPRRSISYDKLHQEPLSLTVIKLDGSRFGIKVAKTATVAEVKLAVEAAFQHLPKNGPGKVSWTHVWGQFCLCHGDQKFLNEGDHIRTFGIKDGDELKFIHHSSSTYDLVRTKSEKDLKSDDEPTISDVFMNEQQGEIFEDMESEDNGCKFRFTHCLRQWFAYRKLANSEFKTKERNCSPRFSLRFKNKKKNHRRQTRKGE